jgi:hypothetical protein
VSTITVSGSDVYVGGGFTQAGGVAIPNGIAKWNGTNWSALGTDIIPSGVQAIAVIGSDVYVAGGFARVGSLSVKNIAKWNGSSWSALGAGLDASVTALAVVGKNLYATGNFATAGGISVNHIAMWDGSNWSDLGVGFNTYATAMAVSGSDLHVGGNFIKAGSKSSYHFAIWHPQRPRASVTILPSGGRFILWNSEPGKFYQVHSTTDLSQSFTPLSGIIPSGGTTTSYSDVSSPNSTARFYEIVEVP